MKKILIVEDDLPLRVAETEHLQKDGFTTLVASNGKEGLSTALTEHPDLILLDVLMPKMHGIEVLQKLRQDSWGKTVPVVVLSNLSDATIERQAKDLGAEYLVKSNRRLHDVENLIAKLLKT